jgi:DUF438 domain-containing protein
MSGYADQTDQRHQQILRFALRILDGPDPSGTVNRERELMDSITVSEVITLVDDLVRQEIPMPRLKTGINKLLNLFHRSLTLQNPQPNTDQPLLAALSRNNRHAEEALDALRPLITTLDRETGSPELISAIRVQLLILLQFCDHYTIMENAIFPAIEKVWPDFRCLSVMWSFHDDIRGSLKETIALISQAEPDRSHFNHLIGHLFFNISAIIFREEKILYPHMLATLGKSDWQTMLKQSQELDWPFDPPAGGDPSSETDRSIPLTDARIDLGSGHLDAGQLTLLFRHLPVDLTLVDEQDRVIFFSEGPQRTFPRSRAIIGRLVQNCHPPESLAAVEAIIEAFRSGSRNSADFWIDMPQGKVLIRYFALRDPAGRYRGTLEVSQEIGSIQGLTGERRLPDWS